MNGARVDVDGLHERWAREDCDLADPPVTECPECGEDYLTQDSWCPHCEEEEAEPTCSGPHTSAYDCPKHGPILRRCDRVLGVNHED